MAKNLPRVAAVAAIATMRAREARTRQLLVLATSSARVATLCECTHDITFCYLNATRRKSRQPYIHLNGDANHLLQPAVLVL